MLNCTTDLAVDTIEWLDMTGTVLANGTDSLLELTDIPTEASDLEYTCNVKNMFGSQSKTVILYIMPKTVSTSTVTVSGAVSAIIAIVMLAVLLLAVIAVTVIVR